MKKIFSKPITLEKVEFWLITGLYLFSLYVITLFLVESVSGFIPGTMHDEFTSRGLPFSFLRNFYIPTGCNFTAFYLAYLFLNFYTIANIANGKAVARNIALSISTFAALTFILIITDAIAGMSYVFAVYKQPLAAYAFLANRNAPIVLMTLVVFTIYTLIKYVLLAIFNNYKISWLSNNPLNRDLVIVSIIWIIVLLFLNMQGLPDGPRIIWVLVIAISILLYFLASAWLIPLIKNKSHDVKTYYVWFAAVLFPFLVLLFAVTQLVFHDLGQFFLLSIINIIVQLLLTAPITWYIYNYRLSKLAELSGLKTALGQSSATLNNLRSQINPHFLFNALNTLYGTALQEEATRTGEGIQKLGDMMRFMLHENMQETISLNREVEYLQNYISLQQLRTQSSPDIVIQADIDEHFNELNIAPMLLIPFVENAFKHGISLREPSFIKIALHTVGSLLYFDVHNSTHIRPENDPEKFNNGMGLENVKQRLNLLYPERHELTIRETTKGFFIHLTIEL